MEIEEFIKAVVNGIREKFGHEYRVEAVEVLRNNGIIFHGISIMHEKKNVAPCIYLDEYYGRYVDEDMNVDAVMEDIIRLYKENANTIDFDMSQFIDYFLAKANLRGRLVNTAKNKVLLQDLPHRDFLDLSLVYYVEISGSDKGIGSILVHNNHMEQWCVCEEELYQAVMENMENLDQGVIQNLMQLIARMAGLEEIPCGLKNGNSPDLYVLSNKEKRDGAVQLLNKRMLKTAAKMFGKDFMVLPSSIHEVLLVPVTEDMEEKDYVVKFADMVREVNDTQVEDTEILSYHVYRYCADTETVVIAA